MVSVLQESAPSYTMVKKWARLFQQGRESCEDDPRPGRPVTISKERVGEIIHEYMNMRKISARWVPKMLMPFDKQRRLQTRIFWSTRGSRTEATWEVIARSAVFTKQCNCPHGAGFEAGPEGHGPRKLTTHPTAQI
ncbi:hypothetical protein EVAR_78686_1 [Eumeta japonica]|uniref:Mos1 transposase HTH domain-containing protein n=1 Tax=Eumeta variegata TaxID=151549 RepID=A0A4C1U878_EUMVA|nr:hypothetical protein EVAR_78686_1 [Eumeta japonica]